MTTRRGCPPRHLGISSKVRVHIAVFAMVALTTVTITSHAQAASPFVMESAKITALNVRYSSCPPNLLNPVLVFDSVTIDGMTLSRPIPGGATLVMSTPAVVSARNVRIASSLFGNLQAISGSIVTRPLSTLVALLTLAACGTVDEMELINVTLPIDSLTAEWMSVPQLSLSIRQ